MNLNGLAIFFIALIFVTDLKGQNDNYYKIETSLAQPVTGPKKSSSYHVSITALGGSTITKGSQALLILDSKFEKYFSKKTFSRDEASIDTKEQLAWNLDITSNLDPSAKLAGSVIFYLCTAKWCRKFDAGF